jgi:hypothetical protein
MLDHFAGMVCVVGMGISAAEYGVNYEPAPGHLERCEPKDLLVCGFDPFAVWSIIIVHDHGVQPEDNNFWGFMPQAPEKEMKQEPAESQSTLPGHGLDESFNGVGRSHVLGGGLNDCCIARVLGQDIKLGQVSAGAIEKEAHELFENLLGSQPICMLANGTEEAKEVWLDADSTKVADEKVDPGSTGQAVGRDLDIVDEICAFAFDLCHPASTRWVTKLSALCWMNCK